jgi:predicted phosphoribosyltransferase
MAVGAFYHDFTQVSDEEVVDLLERSAKNLSA